MSLQTNSPSPPLSTSLPAPSAPAPASAAPAPGSIPTPTLVGICVAAGVLLAAFVIFALWRDRSRKKVPKRPPLEPNYFQHASTQDMKLRGLTPVHAPPPPPVTTNPLRRPSTDTTAYDHGYHGYQNPKPAYDYDRKQSPDAGYLPPIGSYSIQEDSFLSFKSADLDTAPSTLPYNPPQSPRSAYAQPITHPYSVGSHPYASPSISHGPLNRPSFERTATSTTAIAARALDPHPQSASPFPGSGARPGYDAYGFESRTVGATPSSSNQHWTLANRPSIESIRSVARKAAQPNFPTEPTYPPPGASTRTRNNSTSTYAGSLRAPKVKAKPTKEEKAKEMAAMDNLIAALDESAETERRRKERLVAAAGITDDPPHVRNSKATGASSSSSRRKDTAITGSYPLPPPEVFRAALSSSTTSRGRVDDEPDDEEIQRWRRS